MRFGFLAILLWCGLIGLDTVHGQEFRKSGTSGYVFLEIPASARSVGLGETGLTLTDAGAEGLFTNPALIGFNQKRYSLVASHANWYVETAHQALGLTLALTRIGTFGAQIIYFDFGSMERTQTVLPGQEGTFISLGTYSAEAYAVGLSFARQLTDKFAFGSSLKYVREAIAEHHSSNAILDIGFVYLTGFNTLRIGTFLQSFGLEAKYADEKFKMPQQLRLGLSGELWGDLAADNRLTLCAEAVHPNDAGERIHLGGELQLLDVLILRGGYKFGYNDEGLCAGVGMRLNSSAGALRIDFAYLKHDKLDTALRYGLVMEF
ncbi:PorV/PorQ family protein [candidate division KSB1 bacterium]|nr:PorV/PorQ family protein [candidate division KSB1 bacterium]